MQKIQIEIQEINRIRDIFLYAKLNEPINLPPYYYNGLSQDFEKKGKFLKRNFLNCNYFDISNREKAYDRKMNGLQYNDIDTWLIRISEANSEMLFQFSYFLKDKEYLYFGKHLHSGPGGFGKYFRDCKAKGISKEDTQFLLIDVLPNSEVHIIKKAKFLSLTKISLKDLYDPNKQDEILHTMLTAILDCLIKQSKILS